MPEQDREKPTTVEVGRSVLGTWTFAVLLIVAAALLEEMLVPGDDGMPKYKLLILFHFAIFWVMFFAYYFRAADVLSHAEADAIVAICSLVFSSTHPRGDEKLSKLLADSLRFHSMFHLALALLTHIAVEPFFKIWVSPPAAPLFPVLGSLIYIDSRAPYKTFSRWANQLGNCYYAKLGKVSKIALFTFLWN